MFDQTNTESGLNEENPENSKREMISKTFYPSMLKNNLNEPSNKSNKERINIGINTKKFDNYNINLGNSLYHQTQKQKKKKERSSKSLKKKKSKSKNHNQDKEEEKRDDSPSVKEISNNYYYNNINNKHQEYIGEKIVINMKNLNLIFNKYKESNNISDFKKEELSDENTYEKRHRLSCIINNSPFINSNIYFKNKKCITSLEPLLGQDKCRFFEKNKNIYEGKTLNKLLERISEPIFQEIDSDINDKLYELDPSKISVGQFHKKDKRYIRNITNLDGNAFLRAFLFNYLEQIISRKDINKLTEIIGRIKVGLKLIKKDKETIDKVLSVFKIIAIYLENNNIISAYIILIKSFSENYDFEKNLMLYMRQCLSESIQRHQCYFIMDYLKEIVQKKYIKIDNKKNQEFFDYESYLKEVINSESNNNELQYELLVYYFLPPIFDIDLIIYTDNNTRTNKITFKYSNVPNDDKDIITVELFIKFGSVSILYSDDYFKKYENIIPLKSKEEYPIDKIQITKNEEKRNCYMCHTIPYEFIQLDYKFEFICKKCLSEIIKNIIKKRFLLFSDTDNSYFHEEFYCNKINYIINPDKNDSYELDISINDIKYILNNNLDIASVFHEKIIKSYRCDKCQKNFGKDLYSYCMDKCGHLICSNCLKDYIFKLTEEKVVFNIYERKLIKLKYFCPECNKEISLSKNLINNLFNDETYINKAEERLIEAAESICCFCGFKDDDKLKKEIKDKDKNKIKNKFVIKNEFVSSNYSEEYYLLMHSMCNNCYKKIKVKDLNDKNKTFFCDFCGEKHHYNNIIFCDQKRKSCCSHI